MLISKSTANYPGLWTTALFRTRLNIFWHPYDKEEVKIPDAFVGNGVQNGTNYGVILKWNNQFFQRKYRTFDMDEKALYTCVCVPPGPPQTTTTTTEPTTTTATTSKPTTTTIETTESTTPSGLLRTK